MTGDLAQQVGNDNATNIINQAKLQIIGDNIQNADEIYNIVNNIAVQNNVTLSQEELETIVALLQEIAQQSYDIEQMKETLENIQQNLDKESSDDQVLDGTAQDDGVVEDDGFVDEDSTDGEDITQNVDPDALGEDIKESSTEDPSLQEETMGEAVEGEDGAVDEETGIPEATEDGTGS